MALNFANTLRLAVPPPALPVSSSQHPMAMQAASDAFAPYRNANTQALRDEIRQLKSEISLLRRRDLTVNHTLQEIDEEMRLAARLQRDFMPKVMPYVGGVQFDSLFRPCSYVSGDLFDIARLDEHHVAFYVVDAVGHGMPAALLTMFLKHALKTKDISTNAYKLIQPGQALALLNDQLVEQELSNATFATALYGFIDTRTLQVTFASAGHPAPVILSPDGTLSEIEGAGSLLGIFQGEEYPEYTFTLSPGQRVLLYTDGVELAFTKAANAFDTERWKTEVAALHNLPLNQILPAFAQVLDNQSGSATPKDDLTMLIFGKENLVQF